MKTCKDLIIIVDDDADDRMLCQMHLGGDEDALLVTLASGEELFRYLDALPAAAGLPGLVLLDYNMPKMTGGEVLVQLRRQARYTSLKVALYSSGMSNDLQKCLKGLEAVHCFSKPSSVEEFVRMKETIKILLRSDQVCAA